MGLEDERDNNPLDNLVAAATDHLRVPLAAVTNHLRARSVVVVVVVESPGKVLGIVAARFKESTAAGVAPQVLATVAPVAGRASRVVSAPRS